MTLSTGPVAQRILFHSPFSARVAELLAVDHCDDMAGNEHLSERTRLDLLSTKPRAGAAMLLCRYAFSPAGAVAAADRERRKGPLRHLVGALDDRAALALVGHPNRFAASLAAKRVGALRYEDMPVAELVDRLDCFAGNERLRVLFAAPTTMLSDSELAASLVALDGTFDTGDLSTVLLAKLFTFRPGLVDAVAATGFPGFTFAAAAASPHLRPDTASVLAASPALNPVARKFVSTNPWVSGAVTGDLQALRGDDLVVAMDFYANLDARYGSSASAAFAFSSQNPNLPDDGWARVRTVAAALEFHITWSDGLPDWVADPLTAAFRENYPEIEADLVPWWRDDEPGDHEPSEPLEWRSEQLELFFARRRVDELAKVNLREAEGLCAHLVTLLGDDLDAWRTVLTLADTFDGTFPELVDVARATTS